MVKSADRTIQILETIGRSERGFTHGELAANLHIPKSSLSSLLSNLLNRGYLALDGTGRHYVLGPQILVLAGSFLSNLDIVKLGQPIIRKVTRDTGESTMLAIRSGDEILTVCKEDCTMPLKGVLDIGHRAPIYATAAGKAILAFLPEEEIRKYLATVKFKTITPKTNTKASVLERELHEIQSGNTAYSREELNEGLSALGLPVFNIYGRVAASVTVIMPTVRSTTEKEKVTETYLRQAALELSRRLGYDTYEEMMKPSR
jgi:DNA-binding IclR family transcriptional regulator